MHEDRRKRIRVALFVGVLLLVTFALATRSNRTPRQDGVAAKQLFGLWRKTSGPGYRNVLRLSPDGGFSQAFVPDGDTTQRKWHGTWAVENDSLLVYCTPASGSLMDDWMNELQLAWAGPESFEILSLSESCLTIKTDDGPMSFGKVASDPAFQTSTE